MLISITYCGKKSFAIDRVANSGKSWQGNGDARMVTPSQAVLLLKFPDQWCLTDAEDAQHLNQSVAIEISDNHGAASVDAADLNKPPEKMTATELAALIKHRFGKELSRNMGRTRLLDEFFGMEKQA